MLANLVPCENSLPGLQTAMCLLCPHTAFPLCVHGKGETDYKLSYLFLYWHHLCQSRALSLWPPLTLITFIKALFPNTFPLSLRASTHKSGGDTTQSTVAVKIPSPMPFSIFLFPCLGNLEAICSRWHDQDGGKQSLSQHLEGCSLGEPVRPLRTLIKKQYALSYGDMKSGSFL